ncbi:MAG: tRNA-uridine aminocarboxypropyltransferase [Saccharospirillum sp.]
MCPQCQYPLSTCLCHAIEPLVCRTRVDILQHPKEANAAKNTGHLCQLCLPHLRRWVGESPEDFAGFRASIEPDDRVFLVYPSPASVTFDQWQAMAPTPLDSPVRLVLIDATWRKAYKMSQLNPWLQAFTALRLTDVTPQYGIRKAPKPGQISTLEALACSLVQVEPGVDVKPLHAALAARKGHFRRGRDTGKAPNP